MAADPNDGGKARRAPLQAPSNAREREHEQTAPATAALQPDTAQTPAVPSTDELAQEPTPNLDGASAEVYGEPLSARGPSEATVAEFGGEGDADPSGTTGAEFGGLAMQSAPAAGVQEQTNSSEVDQQATQTATGEAGADASSQEGGTPDVWWMPLVETFAPELVPLIDEGLASYLDERINAAALTLAEGMGFEKDLAAMAEELGQRLAEMPALIEGALAGDADCCEMVGKWSDSILQIAQLVIDTRPSLQAFTEKGAQFDDLATQFGGLLNGEWLSDKLAGLAEWLQGWVDTVAWADQGAAEALATHLGLGDGKGIASSLIAYAEERLAGMWEGAELLLDGMLTLAFMIPGLESKYRETDSSLEALSAAMWLFNNWGQEDLMLRAREELQGVGPQFVEDVTTIIDAVGGAWTAALPMLETISNIGMVAGALMLGLPFTAPFAPIVFGMSAGLAWAIGDVSILDMLGGAWEGFKTSVITPFMEVMHAIPSNPVAMFQLDLIANIQALPECYQGLILDAYAGVMIASSALLTEVLVGNLPGLGPVLAPMILEMLSGALDGFTSLALEEKVAFVEQIRKLNSLGPIVELGTGFCVGLVQAVIDELAGIVLGFGVVIGGTVGGIAGSAYLLSVLFDAAGDRHFQEDGSSPENAAPTQDEGSGAGTPETGEVDTGAGDTPTGLDQLEAWLGGLWEGFMEGLHQAGASIAQALVGGIGGAADGGMYTTGTWAGFTVGAIALLFLPSKIISLVGRLAKVPKAINALIKAYEAGEKVLDPLFDAIGTISSGAFDAARAALKPLANLPGIKQLMDALDTLWDYLKRVLDDIAGKLALRKGGKEAAEKASRKAAKEAAEEAAEKKAKKAAKDKKDREDAEDDTDEKKAARKAARDGWDTMAAYTAKNLRDMADLTKKLGGLPSRVLGTRIAYKIEELGDKWQVQATATGEGKAKRDEGAGWIAKDKAGKAQGYGATDASKANEDIADLILDDAQDEFVEIGETVEANDDELLEDEMDKEAKSLESKLKYPEMKVVNEVEEVEVKDGVAQAEALVMITPNTTEVRRKVTARKGDDFDALFDKAADLYWAAHLDEPWATVVAEAEGAKAWSAYKSAHMATGKAGIKPDVESEFNSWNESKTKFEDRIAEYIRKNHRSGLMLPAVEAMAKDTDKLADLNKTEAKIASEAGVSEKLKAAIKGASYGGEKGVVAFLLEVAAGSSGGISRAEFIGDGPEGWDHANPTLANRDHVKTKFRTAAKGGGGYHEWIPCSELANLVGIAKDEETALLAAEWIQTAHKLRSATWCVIFEPSQTVEQAAEDKVTELMESGKSAREAADEFTVGGDFTLSGHCGALYLDATVDGKTKRVQQTKGTGAFHSDLAALASGYLDQDPDEFEDPLLDHIDRKLWSGDINFVPKRIRDEDDVIDSEYVGSSQKTWANKLRPFRDEAEKAKAQVGTDIALAF